jgi:DNA-binding response OmpR family regulator
VKSPPPHRADSLGSRALRIGDCVLDLGSQRLQRGDVSRILDAKAVGVLLHLVEAAPEFVPTADLLARSWADSVVGDNSLHQVIGRLLRLRNDNAADYQSAQELLRAAIALDPHFYAAYTALAWSLVAGA